MCNLGGSEGSLSGTDGEEQELWEETQIGKGVKRRPGEQVKSSVELICCLRGGGGQFIFLCTRLFILLVFHWSFQCGRVVWWLELSTIVATPLCSRAHLAVNPAAVAAGGTEKDRRGQQGPKSQRFLLPSAFHLSRRGLLESTCLICTLKPDHTSLQNILWATVMCVTCSCCFWEVIKHELFLFYIPHRFCVWLQVRLADGGAQSTAGRAKEDGGGHWECQNLSGDTRRKFLREAAPVLPFHDRLHSQPSGVSAWEGQE